MKEHDLAVLMRAIPEHRLEAGDVGTVVHIYSGAAAFEIEFVAGNGETVAVLTLEAKDVRPFNSAELLHVRPVAA